MPNPTVTAEAAGVQIPLLGFGTWQLEPDVARRMVRTALEIGYRHIDTAWIYKNEKTVGEGIRDSGVPRDQIFLTTKIWVAHFADGNLQRQAEESAESLGTVPDLLLLHWPKRTPAMEETVRALNDARARGLTKHIGLSNFPSAAFEEAQGYSDAPLITNQVEHHPYLSNRPLIDMARTLGSTLTAWSPLAQGKVADEAVLIEIGRTHSKTPGQVTLRWLVQQGIIAIPRSTRESRARENFNIWDFQLGGEEMQRISRLARTDGRLGDWLDPSFQWDAAA